LFYFVIIACIAALVMYTLQHGVENTLDDLSNVVSNVSQTVQETTGNISQTVQELSKPIERAYFESVDELIIFLDADNVSDIEWTEDFVCADFTDTLIERAVAAGYNTLLYRGMEGVELNRYSDVMATVSFTSPYGRTWRSLGLKLSGAGHAVCETTVCNLTIIIEPQNDMIFKLSNGHYTVLYKGEITKYGQKLPEPDDRTYFKSIDDLILFFDNDNFSKIEWNESVMDWDWDSSDWNEVMSGYYNGERFEWGWDLLDVLSERATVYGCNTLLSCVIRGDELRAYSNALSTISYQSGSTIWSYRGLDLSSIDTKIVFKTTIGNNTIVIAPQTDIIFNFKDGEYIVLYAGEITKNEE